MRFLLPLASLLAASAVSAAQPEKLTFLTEDYPPENYLERGELKGYAVDVLKAIWRKQGVPESPIQVLPWARAYHTFRTQPNHVLFAMARTPERDPLFKWVGPIHRVRESLFALAGKDPGARTLAEARNLRVGVMIQDVGEEMLRRADFPDEKLVKVRTFSQLLKMLKAERVDLICASENALMTEITRDASLAMTYVPVVEIGLIDIYYAFSPGTSDAVVARYQAALTSIDAERRAILDRYGIGRPPGARGR